MKSSNGRGFEHMNKEPLNFEESSGNVFADC